MHWLSVTKNSEVPAKMPPFQGGVLTVPALFSVEVKELKQILPFIIDRRSEQDNLILSVRPVRHACPLAFYNAIRLYVLMESMGIYNIMTLS